MRLNKIQIFPRLVALSMVFILFDAAAQPSSQTPTITYDDHLVQANLLFKQGKLEDALGETQAAQKVDAKRFEAPATAALILHAQNKSSEAKAAIDAALKLAPADKLEKVQAIAKLVEAETKTDVIKPSSPATPELSGATKRQLNVLTLIVEEADKATLDAERKKLLTEFLDKSTEFVKENPGQLPVWTLRAVAALELGQGKTGWEAGQQMTKLGADNSDDAKVQKVMAMLDRKGWLNRDLIQEINSKEEAEKQNRIAEVERINTQKKEEAAERERKQLLLESARKRLTDFQEHLSGTWNGKHVNDPKKYSFRIAFTSNTTFLLEMKNSGLLSSWTRVSDCTITGLTPESYQITAQAIGTHSKDVSSMNVKPVDDNAFEVSGFDGWVFRRNK